MAKDKIEFGYPLINHTIELKILLLSDTHSHIDASIEKHMLNADEIWHAGDIGSISVIDKMEEIGKVRGVYGNIDNKEIRLIYPQDQIFEVEGVKVFMTHIAGYPKKYNSVVKNKIKKLQPQLVICGHSHILKVMYDNELKHLHMNPGAAGKHGFHQVRTLLRFQINMGEISDLEVIELEKRV